MIMKKLYSGLFVIIFISILSACNQTIEDPANPMVNKDYSREEDVKGKIIEVDEIKDQLLIHGKGLGLNEEGEGIIQLDTRYYTAESFEKNQTVRIWMDKHAEVEKSDIPVIHNVAKMEFAPKKED